jgi:beta-glucuronidase
LHQLKVCIGDDCVTELVGIRTVTVSGRKILVNGEPVRLFGFNRHEASSESGHTQSDQLLVTDIQLLEDMGVNFVRGSHYPQDERFVDLCDRRGIMMWCEAIGWQHTDAHLTDRRFLDAQSVDIQEMIQALGNHPSIIMWGLLNESEGQKRTARPGFAELVEVIRSEDPSRPVTYATCHVYEDKCLDLFDIVSFNNYPGWYVGGAKGIPQELDAILAHLDGSGYADKPIILSEIGAGGIYGFRDWHRGLWSEEYQAEVIKTVLDYFSNVERLNGLTLWQFCDIRASESTDRALRRPKGFNNKGIVDEHRRAKLAYHIVREFGKAGATPFE